MSEDDEPSWQAELAMTAEAFRRQIEEGDDALRQQVEQLGRAVDQFVRDGHRTAPGASPVAPLQQRVLRAAEAAIRELVAPQPEPEVHVGGFKGYFSFGAIMAGSAGLPGEGTITATGSVTLPRLRVSGQGTVKNPGEAERGIGQILLFMLVLIVGSGLLGVQGPDRTAVDHYVTVIFAMLPVAIYVWNMHNKQK